MCLWILGNVNCFTAEFGGFIVVIQTYYYTAELQFTVDIIFVLVCSSEHELEAKSKANYLELGTQVQNALCVEYTWCTNDIKKTLTLKLLCSFLL